MPALTKADPSARSYRVQEFAELAGVTVRTLHHYDRLGLLKPQRSASGYRCYSEAHLLLLEQIVALKFIGVPLKQIPRMLKLANSATPAGLHAALRAQRQVLEERRAQLNRALAAVREAEAEAAQGRHPNSSLLKTIIEVLEMQKESEWAMQYYTDEAKAKIEERRKQWTPELQAETEQKWNAIFADVRAAIAAGEDPASPVAQSLAARWREMVGAFTGGDPQVAQGLNKLWADKANWPQPAQQKMQPWGDPAVWEFVQTAMAAVKK